MVTESGLSAQNVASSFVKQYYTLLEICPENVHKFYQESSQLGWAEPDGAVTTLREIDDKIMASDYKDWYVDLKYVDAQYSKDGGVMVAVTGVLTGKDNKKKNFNQTFFLAKQERAPSTTSICHKLAQIEFEVENGNVEEKSSPVLKESVPINISSDSSDEDTNSTIAPVSHIKEESQKISYASVLAKANHVTSPKSVIIPLKADYKTAISTPKADYKTAVSTAKASSPPGNGSSEASNTTNAYIEGRGIYIGNLPYNVTKQAIAEEIKKFGPVRKGLDGIHIRRHEDGYCYGFVEFESADSARHAVEAHRIYFGEKDSYISYKKASNQGNNNKGKGRSPPRARFPNNDPRGRDTNGVTSNGRFDQNGNHSGFDKGQARDAQPSRQAAERW